MLLNAVSSVTAPLLRSCGALAAVMLLSGCSLFFRSPRLDVDGFAPIASARRPFVEAALTVRPAVRILRSSYSTKLTKSIQSTTVRQVLVFERPDKLRIELFVTGLNHLGALISVSGDQLQALFPDDGVAYLGTPSPENIQKLLNVPLNTSQVMDWISGGFQAELGEGKIFENAKTGEYLVTGRDSFGRCIREVLKLVPETQDTQKTLRLRGLEVTECESDEVTFRAEYRYATSDSNAPVSKGCPITMPSEISFWLPSDSVEAVMTLENARCNSDLSARREQLFRPRLPEGITVHLLNEVSGFSPGGELESN